MINLLNSFFSTCFNTSYPLLSSSDSNPAGADECPQEFLWATEEVEHFLLSLDKSKATGPDGVSATMLKCTATSIAPFVTQLFNLCIQPGKVPTEWKQALVVRIPKSYNLSSPNNYRPISLLSILSKLLEQHIHMLITTHLTENNIMSDAQWVFQQARAQLQLCLIQLTTGLRSWKMESMSVLYFLTTVRCLTQFRTDPCCPSSLI